MKVLRRNVHATHIGAFCKKTQTQTLHLLRKPIPAREMDGEQIFFKVPKCPQWRGSLYLCAIPRTVYCQQFSLSVN